MAKQIIEYASSRIKISQVIIDSWYVCNEIIKLCVKKDMTLIGNLKLMMFFKKVYWTIDECIKYIQDKEFDDLIIKIIEIEDIEKRRKMAKLLLLSENAKV